jgi:hypothetical protein
MHSVFLLMPAQLQPHALSLGSSNSSENWHFDSMYELTPGVGRVDDSYTNLLKFYPPQFCMMVLGSD